MNFFNRKTQQKIALVICIILVIAMIVPMVFGYLV